MCIGKPISLIANAHRFPLSQRGGHSSQDCRQHFMDIRRIALSHGTRRRRISSGLAETRPDGAKSPLHSDGGHLLWGIAKYPQGFPGFSSRYPPLHVATPLSPALAPLSPRGNPADLAHWFDCLSHPVIGQRVMTSGGGRRDRRPADRSLHWPGPTSPDPPPVGDSPRQSAPQTAFAPPAVVAKADAP